MAFIKIDRQIMNWEWYKNIPVRILFEHCLLKANFKPGRFEGKTIEVGQFVTSLDSLSYETGLTKQQVRTALNKLKSTHEITYTSTSRYSIITVNNWSKYQGDNTPSNTRITHKQHSNNIQITPIEEGKERKEGKNVYFLEKSKKLSDPFMGKTKEVFCDTYEKIFNKKVYLSFQECNKLTELSSLHDNFEELIPIALNRLKVIDFPEIDFKPSANWLLKDSNFERVLNGEFGEEKMQQVEVQQQKEKKQEQNLDELRALNPEMAKRVEAFLNG